MARARSPSRDKAFELWKESDGKRLLKDIAAELNVTDTQVRKWKNQDKWNEQLKGNVTNEKRNVTNKSNTNNQQNKSNEKVTEFEEVPLNENGELTDKQWLFSMYYIRSLNATNAYKKVYECSYQTAMTNGSRLLSNAKVRETISELKRQRLESLDLDQYDVLEKYKAIAFSDITDFIDFTQVESEATETMVEFNTDGSKKSEKTETVPYTYTKFAMHHSGEIDGTLITELAKGKDGMFKLKLADKMAALAFLAKYTDLLSENDRKKLQNEKIKMDIQKTKAEIDNMNDDEDDSPIEIVIKRKGERS
ncbi:terminase small subunit [Fictibacillus sp. JL2B1089]|uniref:terminase small subunit n=1 Tax=Fictibacillus sp. JL2B1089 TaxID=3399565 RepID=UPI003A8B4140